MYSAISLINYTGMLPYPIGQSFCSDLRHLSTSLYVAFRILKLLGLFVSESLWDSMTSPFVVFSPISLSAVLSKNLFSADRSA